MRTQSMVCAVVVALALSLVGTSAHGQDGDWTYELTPMYLWAIFGDGDVVARGVSSDVDFGFSYVVDDLEFAFIFSEPTVHNRGMKTI